MIKSLYIKQFALVDELTVSFTEGLNIITGETGAGKSILVNAIAQLCGERASTELIRTDASKAIIEAQIAVQPWKELEELVKELELEIEDYSEIFIRKEIRSSGNTRTFVNDSPVTLNQLGRFSGMLLDLHGQHQHQRLLHPEHHIHYLDAYGSYSDLLQTYASLLSKYKTQLHRLSDLKQQQLEAFQKQDMYRFQFDELTKANLQDDELTNLRAEYKILSNVETLSQAGGEVSATLYSAEPNASLLLSRAEEALRQLEALDDSFAGLADNCTSARETVEEIGRFTEQYLSGLEYNPQRMEYVHQRISQLEFLLKKYQQSNVEGLIRLRDEIHHLLNDTAQFDEQINEARETVDALIARLNNIGHKLTEVRKATAEQFVKAMDKVLAEIGMEQAHFRVSIEHAVDKDSLFTANGKAVQAQPTGFDVLIFEIASNKGEPFRPLHKIASGGEISRIMLALKSILAESDQIPSLVFDEIDVGISGKIAQIVGRKLAKLSQLHQILCVTHLPQIAAFADSHYKVLKKTEENHTFVEVKPLDMQLREMEIAYLLGGEALSAQAVENARHLIAEAQII